MKKGTTVLVVAGFLLALTLPAVAQDTPAPRIIQIFREEVKPGKGPAHAKVETGWPKAFAKANWPTNYVGMTTITGPTEAWFISGWDSYAAWEKDTQAAAQNAALSAELDRLSGQDGDLLSSVRSIVATYREDLSHRPGVSIPRMRYLSVTIVRIRPGHNADFEEARKIVKAAHERAGVKDNHSVFQVTSGWPNGTFLIITPLRSLAEVDAGPQVHGTAYRDAIGDPGRAKLRELASAGTLSSETMIFSFNPGMSYVAKEWVEADPDFWAPKPPKPMPAKAPSKQP